MMARKVALLTLPGDYTTPEEARDAARFLVLMAIERDAPEVIEDLAVSVDVAAWARRWRLDVPWAREQAEETRALWAEYPHILTDRQQYPRPSWGVMGGGEGWVGMPDDRGLSWNPRTETEAAFRARVDTYVRARRAGAEEAGYVAPPAKDREAFAWLVRHHLRREPYAQIAGHGDGAGVERAVKRLARLIGLSLR